jgi:uncharacterized protein YfaS (alpha-2-macroglobulin family)
LSVFNSAMNSRYGTPTDRNDYMRKAMVMDYEGWRVQHEAYEINKTGTNGVSNQQRTRPWKKLSGIVRKLIKDGYRHRADIVEVDIHEAEDLFREVRIENTFTDLDGQKVSLKQGAHLDITFETEPEHTIRRTDQGQA